MNELAKRSFEPEVERWSVSDIQTMAEQVSRSKLFGLDPAQAFTLMCLAQSEGIHPIKAVQRFHVIQGRPSMKSDAMLADFLRIGGTVKWVTESDDKERCEAIFKHPQFAPEGKAVRFSMADAKMAGLTGNANWQKYPSNMMRARVISSGVRMIAPGIVAGLYTPEEVQDFDEPRTAHHAANHNNDTGHGSGAYAKPETVDEFVKWIETICEDVNTKWLDHVTSKDGEVNPKAPAEIINRFQLAGHLLKWGQASGLVNAPEDSRAGTRDKYAAVVWDRSPEAAEEEATSYCRDEWRKAKAKMKPSQDKTKTDRRTREPGDDDMPDEAVLELSSKGL